MAKRKPITCEDCEYGWNGSGGGSRSALFGKKGQGRADRIRSYTVWLEHDGRRVARTVGPGYDNKKGWQRRREEAIQEILAELNS